MFFLNFLQSLLLQTLSLSNSWEISFGCFMCSKPTSNNTFSSSSSSSIFLLDSDFYSRTLVFLIYSSRSYHLLQLFLHLLIFVLFYFVCINIPTYRFIYYYIIHRSIFYFIFFWIFYYIILILKILILWLCGSFYYFDIGLIARVDLMNLWKYMWL